MWTHPAGTLDLAHSERWQRPPLGHFGSGSISPIPTLGSASPASPSSPVSGTSSPVTPPEQVKVHNLKKELKLDANERWNEALARIKEAGYQGPEEKTDVRSRFARAALYSHHSIESAPTAYDSDSDSDDSGSESAGGSEEKEEQAWTRHLEEMHYLEMIDPKHRYGSNLKYYHRRWVDEDTEDNFFRWLDRGAGKNLSLPECPRQHLESATVRYLTPEQRYHYLASIDPFGRVRWAHNTEYVDTTPGRWEDTGEGRGVEPAQMGYDSLSEGNDSEPGSSSPPTPASPRRMSSFGASDDDPGQKYASENFRQSLTEHLLRKTLSRRLKLKKETWIYVASAQYELYIGLKSSGSFQHTSFLAGGVIASAGTITVGDGMVQSLNPLSGHYRASIEHFKSFVNVLEKRGADLSRVSISKFVASLWGPNGHSLSLSRALSSPAHTRRSVRSLQQTMLMTPIFPPSSPYAGSVEDYDEERMARRREALYGRPPSDKAKKSLESVVEVEEPPEDLMEQGGWV